MSNKLHKVTIGLLLRINSKYILIKLFDQLLILKKLGIIRWNKRSCAVRRSGLIRHGADTAICAIIKIANIISWARIFLEYDINCHSCGITGRINGNSIRRKGTRCRIIGVVRCSVATRRTVSQELIAKDMGDDIGRKS